MTTTHPASCTYAWCRAHRGPDAEGAERRIALARIRLRATRRAFVRRQAGAADLFAAECALDAALEDLRAVLIAP